MRRTAKSQKKKKEKREADGRIVILSPDAVCLFVC
jgi:hypothetical protein